MHYEDRPKIKNERYLLAQKNVAMLRSFGMAEGVLPTIFSQGGIHDPFTTQSLVAGW
jgi:hypothetical protein